MITISITFLNKTSRILSTDYSFGLIKELDKIITRNNYIVLKVDISYTISNKYIDRIEIKVEEHQVKRCMLDELLFEIENCFEEKLGVEIYTDLYKEVETPPTL